MQFSPAPPVSIPFIAGQWSLLVPCLGGPRLHVVFQSPSLRGSGRFTLAAQARARAEVDCFNPLHCGAVVASTRRTPRTRRPAPVSIPFIAGQWSLPAHFGGGPGLARRVSIPFIAGQWSLPGPHGGHHGGHRDVSIPFIAGQWSLREAEPGLGVPGLQFQSPSLRGSGRFAPAPRRRRRCAAGFNPLHCGAVVASRKPDERVQLIRLVSIPFIAGQWSLRARFRPCPRSGPRFQSPSLRGSGRFIGRSERKVV